MDCGLLIDFDADWTVNDRTHNAFLDRLEISLAAALGWPRDQPPPHSWRHFRHLALTREQDGREEFGLSYLDRDNLQAGAEENSDGINYSYFHALQEIHCGEEPQMDLILTAAYHDFMAYQTRLRIRAHRLGSPA